MTSYGRPGSGTKDCRPEQNFRPTFKLHEHMFQNFGSIDNLIENQRMALLIMLILLESSKIICNAFSINMRSYILITIIYVL